MARVRLTRTVTFFAATWAVAHGLLWFGAPVAGALGVLALTVALPGALAARLILGRDRATRGPLERSVIAFALGFGVQSVVLLLLSYLPGGLGRVQTLLAFDALILLLGVAALSLPDGLPADEMHGEDHRLWWAAAGILLLGALLRLPNLGYAEFHGDEARALLRAVAVLQGHEDVLFLHRKGPVEILIPAAQLVLAGSANEAAARLPFVAANLAALLAALLIGRRIFGLAGGVVAALLLAVNGYYVAFARFVQYQSVVLLLTAAALLLLLACLDGRRLLWRSLCAAALLLAVALLAHWDALAGLIPVAILWLALGRKWGWGVLARATVPALGAGVGVLALYFVPLLLHPAAAGTLAYLRDERIGGSGGPPYNNLADFVLRRMLYGSPVLLVLFSVLLLAAALLAVSKVRRGSPPTAPETALWLWLLLPAAGFLFLVATPRTHVHVFDAPWALLAGGAVAALWRWAGSAGRRGMRSVLAAAGALLLLYLAGHPLLTFVYAQRELVREESSLFRSLYATPVTAFQVDGRFGFPFANGWKAIGALYAQGDIAGPYETNQRYDWIPQWYAPGQRRCAADAQWFFAGDVLEPWAEDNDAIADRIAAQGFAPRMAVTVKGAPRMQIYAAERAGDALPAGSVAVESLAGTASGFAEWPLDYPVIIPAMAHAIGVKLGGEVVLEGYSLTPADSFAPGESFELVIFWRALRPVRTAYTVFVQAYDVGGRMVAQSDGQPVCDREPTPTWSTGETVVDRRVITLAQDSPPGLYPLMVGMYDPATGVRLPIVDGAGVAVDDKVQLAEIVVE